MLSGLLNKKPPSGSLVEDPDDFISLFRKSFPTNAIFLSKNRGYQRGVRAWRFSCKVKLIEEPPLEGWTGSLGLPAPGYFEPFGPYLIQDLDWILIDPVERRKMGRLIPEKTLDHTEEISRIFKEKDLDYQMEDFYFKVSF